MRGQGYKLGALQQRWLHAATFLVFVSGIAWAAFHYFGQRATEFGPAIHPAEPWLLQLHGLAAMLILVVLGSLIPLHMRGAWLARKNRRSGAALVGFFLLLTLTGYGLYYAGNEKLREWTSGIHLGLGLLLPGCIVLHIWLGKNTSRKGAKAQSV